MVGLLSATCQVASVVLGVVIAWRWLYRPGGWASRHGVRAKTVVENLDERYARGEIDAAEDAARQTRLLGDRAPSRRSTIAEGTLPR